MTRLRPIPENSSDNAMTMMRILFAMLLLAGATACGSRSTRPAAAETKPAAPTFRTVVPPVGLQAEEVPAYMREHYWDRFDFTDTLFIMQIDTVQMQRAFAAYAANFVDPAHPEPMAALMRRASTSKRMFSYFAMLAESVLADPNSPLRNDELYIPVLEEVVASPLWDQWEKIAPQSDLEMARQNRIGHKANDFRYTVASGATRRLYDLQADYVLLFINNPGCPMCKEIREAICASPMLSEAIERGTVKVLALYPDEDLGEWEAYREHIPASWINAYDRGCRIREEGSYNLAAIPALYLLDRDKRVLVKDATDVGYVEWVLDHAS